MTSTAATWQQHRTNGANHKETKRLLMNATCRSRIPPPPQYLPDPAVLPRARTVLLAAAAALHQLFIMINVREKRKNPQPEAKISISCHISRETPPSAVTELSG